MGSCHSLFFSLQLVSKPEKKKIRREKEDGLVDEMRNLRLDRRATVLSEEECSASDEYDTDIEILDEKKGKKCFASSNRIRRKWFLLLSCAATSHQPLTRGQPPQEQCSFVIQFLTPRHEICQSSATCRAGTHQGMWKSWVHNKFFFPQKDLSKSCLTKSNAHFRKATGQSVTEECCGNCTLNYLSEPVLSSNW